MFDIDELIDWYRAQLDEDERVALAAAEAAGTAQWGTTPDGSGTATGPVEVAWHIARHSPARVLREIAARRQLLDSRFCTERVLRFLLLPYADRPGYHQHWAPGDESYYVPGPRPSH